LPAAAAKVEKFYLRRPLFVSGLFYNFDFFQNLRPWVLPMKKTYRVKKNEEFQRIFQQGKSVANRQFIIYKLENGIGHFRIGLSVGKKIGNAVTRNRIKRYIRQTFTELREKINPSYDYIIIARKPAKDMDYHEVKKSLIHVLKLARAIRENGKGPGGRYESS